MKRCMSRRESEEEGDRGRGKWRERKKQSKRDGKKQEEVGRERKREWGEEEKGIDRLAEAAIPV